MNGNQAADNVGIDRRTWLRLAGSGTALAVLAACTGARPSTPAAGPTTGGSSTTGPELVPAPVTTSAAGRLDVELTAAASMLPWGSTTRYALTYNGTTPGPTLRVRPGDTLRITLHNALDEPTNLHTHGLHVSPSGSSDNIFVMVAPGESITYEYAIPADHPSGTFWYHPHHHGTVARQISGGLAGAIIVADHLDDLPTMAASVERTLVLSDPKIGATAAVLDATAQEQMLGREGDVVLVNGQHRPHLTATTGTVERWRIVNASPSRYHRLTIDGPAWAQIASDHGRFAAPLTITDLVLTPGQRAELLVPLTAAGTITLTSTPITRAGGMMGGMGGMGGARTGASPSTLATLTVTGQASSPPALPAQLRDPAVFDAPAAVSTRTVTLGAMGMGAGQFVIDGHPFDANRVDISVAAGTTEEWRLVNQSMMNHPFHLHVWPFQVIARSDGSAPDPGWRDTVDVPAGGTVTIRIPFRDHTGTTVYHCHILDHEDLGMMGIVRVA